MAASPPSQSPVVWQPASGKIASKASKPKMRERCFTNRRKAQLMLVLTATAAGSNSTTSNTGKMKSVNGTTNLAGSA